MPDTHHQIESVGDAYAYADDFRANGTLDVETLQTAVHILNYYLKSLEAYASNRAKRQALREMSRFMKLPKSRQRQDLKVFKP